MNAEIKTKKTEHSVRAFLEVLPDEEQRAGCLRLTEIMQTITGAEPKLWGTGIVGFGDMHYQYASGREGDWFLTGFSPRKQNITVYLSYGFEKHADLMSRLGTFKTGKACIYIRRMTDVDEKVLAEVIKRALKP